MELTMPIKRSKYLAGLSREHHDALLFVWKLRKGVNSGIAPSRMARYCEWYWENYMKVHFSKEEVELSKILPKDHPMMVQMIDDHQAICKKINEVTDNGMIIDIKRLADIIYHHVRFEERNLFNVIEREATEKQLRSLYLNLVQSTFIHDNEWPDKFWLYNI